MPPRLLAFDITNSRVVDSETCCNVNLPDLAAQQFPDRQNQLFVEFGHSVFGPCCSCAVMIHVIVILLGSSPRKVLDSIVTRTAIEMPAPAVIGARANESLKNKPVYSSVLPFAISAEVDEEMTFAMWDGNERALTNANRSAAMHNGALKRFHATLVRDKIEVRESDYVFPYLSQDRLVYSSWPNVPECFILQYVDSESHHELWGAPQRLLG